MERLPERRFWNFMRGAFRGQAFRGRAVSIMNAVGEWLFDLRKSHGQIAADGLVEVDPNNLRGDTPEQIALMEKAREYGAHFVFFQAQDGRPPIAQAFVYLADDGDDPVAFAELHQRLWSWGGVPLLYRTTLSRVDLFRCAHRPDFLRKGGEVIYNPTDTLLAASDVAEASAWWSAERLRNGTLWDEPVTCDRLLSGSKSAHKSLIGSIKSLSDRLDEKKVLPAALRRRLLIISLLVAYLEERGALDQDIFRCFNPGAEHFFQILREGDALVELLRALHDRFNGNVFRLTSSDEAELQSSHDLVRYATLIEGHTEPTGQLSFWRLYSFRDLPVELISHIYQLFVDDPSSSVYTPPALVRLMIGEALSWERLDRLHENNEVILDPACGSGIFLVEAYKRMVLHWRSRNNWSQPDVFVLKKLLTKVHGVDLEPGAVELANFSLCLALCDALEPQAIRASFKLFPELTNTSLHNMCFFEALECGVLHSKVGVVLGNPPFISKLTTPGAIRSYKDYRLKHGAIPDLQLAYLFLHEAMLLLAPGGILCLLQQYGFIYNQNTLGFRRSFFKSWNVREILDFISVRGLFQKGSADTKVVVVLAFAEPPPERRPLLHAVFRRNGRVAAGQGFDIDHYDLHWIDLDLVQEDDAVWRANLFGGGRVLDFLRRLRKFPTLGDYAAHRKWKFGEGFAEGQRGVAKPAAHINGHPYLPSTALTLDGIDEDAIAIYGDNPIEGPRTEALFTPPMLLVREQMDLPHAIWTQHYMTFKNQIVGFAAPKEDKDLLDEVSSWLSSETLALQAYVAGSSGKLFTQKATSLLRNDILAIPYPEDGNLNCSENEMLLAHDMVHNQRDLIRLGEDADVMRADAREELSIFSDVFTRQINQIYCENPLRPLPYCWWQGVICQPYVFGEGDVEWEGSDVLQGRLDALIRFQRGTALTVTRIARLYDDRYIFLIKPDRLRYWLSSTALRDADETLSDLRLQGF